MHMVMRSYVRQNLGSKDGGGHHTAVKSVRSTEKRGNKPHPRRSWGYSGRNTTVSSTYRIAGQPDMTRIVRTLSG